MDIFQARRFATMVQMGDSVSLAKRQMSFAVLSNKRVLKDDSHYQEDREMAQVIVDSFALFTIVE